MADISFNISGSISVSKYVPWILIADSSTITCRKYELSRFRNLLAFLTWMQCNTTGFTCGVILQSLDLASANEALKQHCTLRDFSEAMDVTHR